MASRMDVKDKTRRERRKESRLIKRKKQFSSWVMHQSKSEKAKDKMKQFVNSKPDPAGMALKKKTKGKSCIAENIVAVNQQNKNLKKRPKSKFHEYLKMEFSEGVFSAAEDMEMERRLAKKLKLKDRNLSGLDDGLNMLMDGISSNLGSEFDEFSNLNHTNDQDGLEVNMHKRKHQESFPEGAGAVNIEFGNAVESKNHKRGRQSKAPAKHFEECYPIDKAVDPVEQYDMSTSKITINPDVSSKYVAPHLRDLNTDESEEHAQIRSRVKGLLNKLSESNLESISGEVAAIFQSVTRSVGCQIVGAEIVASCRRNELQAAAYAAFVAGMACMVGIDFSAKLLTSVAISFEDEYSKNNKLALRNLTLLFCYFYIFGVCASDIIFDLLDRMSQCLTELNVSTILTILQCCGMKLRGDDPTSMKEFVVSFQNRVNALQFNTKNIKEGEPEIDNKRMKFMLETICDIKNNKKRLKEDPAQHTRIKKWLQKLRTEDVLLRNLTWSKLLDPEKKGQWWLAGDINSSTVNYEKVASTFTAETLESQKLLKLAAAQRMNTDVRRAIFCILMSGEDYIDAFEKILRLDLSGKQDREIMRVIVDCCLQEKVFNKYYTVLASKFCSHDKNHKFTLQYCIWDHQKEIDSMDLHRSMNLARFLSEMLSSFSVSLALLKAVDLMDPSHLTPRRIMHFRMLFETLFENTDALLWNIFTRVAAVPELESLRSSIVSFIKHYVVLENSENSLALKFRVVKKALDNAAGVLM